MTVPFTAFTSLLNWQQVSLLLDTVQYFAEAPKWLSIPDEAKNSIPVPMTADTLRVMLGVLDEEDAFTPQAFTIKWESSDREDAGTLVVGLPSGEQIHQPAVLSMFSPV